MSKKIITLFLLTVLYYDVVKGKMNFDEAYKEALKSIRKDLKINHDYPENFNFSRFSDGKPNPLVRYDAMRTIAYYGYNGEQHKVVTKDGYIIEMHRITGSKKWPSPKGKPAILLQHGILCSSMDWVIAGPKRSLGFLLADAGYDVWLGNARGNRYSRHHNDTNISKKQYWDFSWHEIAVHDLPSMIDYILEQTGNKKIAYVGHSQGTTVLFAMLSEHPEYNNKLTAGFALSPVSFVGNLSSPLLQLLAKLMLLVPEVISNTIMDLFGTYEFEPSESVIQDIAAIVCDQFSLLQGLCSNVIFLICGFSYQQLDTKLLPVIFQNVPAGSSLKQFLHFSQLMNAAGTFKQYDHGYSENVRRYRRSRPPHYNLKNVKIPVSLHYSVNDWISSPTDVNILKKNLPNVIGKFRVPNDYFNHMDFMWAKDLYPLLNNKVMSLIFRYHKR